MNILQKIANQELRPKKNCKHHQRGTDSQGVTRCTYCKKILSENKKEFYYECPDCGFSTTNPKEAEDFHECDD